MYKSIDIYLYLKVFNKIVSWSTTGLKISRRRYQSVVAYLSIIRGVVFNFGSCSSISKLHSYSVKLLTLSCYMNGWSKLWNITTGEKTRLEQWKLSSRTTYLTRKSWECVLRMPSPWGHVIEWVSAAVSRGLSKQLTTTHAGEQNVECKATYYIMSCTLIWCETINVLLHKIIVGSRICMQHLINVIFDEDECKSFRTVSRPAAWYGKIQCLTVRIIIVVRFWEKLPIMDIYI